MFLYLKEISCVSHYACCFSHWKETGLAHSLLLSKYLYTLIRSMLRFLFSRLNNLSSLSISSYEKCPNSSLSFLAISWTPSSSSVPLFTWWAWTLIQKYLTEAERKDHLSWSLGDPLTSGAQGAGNLCWKGTFLAPGQLAAQKDPKVTLENCYPASWAPACTGV